MTKLDGRIKVRSCVFQYHKLQNYSLKIHSGGREWECVQVRVCDGESEGAWEWEATIEIWTLNALSVSLGCDQRTYFNSSLSQKLYFSRDFVSVKLVFMTDRRIFCTDKVCSITLLRRRFIWLPLLFSYSRVFRVHAYSSVLNQLHYTHSTLNCALNEFKI